MAYESIAWLGERGGEGVEFQDRGGALLFGGTGKGRRRFAC